MVSLLMTVILSPILALITHIVVSEKNQFDTPLWQFAALTFVLTQLIIYIQFLLGYNAFISPPKLFQRFADKKASKILWITVRDHYVDVYTNRGKETLLMRFSDALAELDGTRGLQIHRSHWVSISAVREFKKENGRSSVILHNGTEVPVSRGYLSAASQEFS